MDRKRYTRYLKLCRWLRRRYSDSNGNLITHVGNKPTRYTRLERMAAAKYLGCTIHQSTTTH